MAVQPQPFGNHAPVVPVVDAAAVGGIDALVPDPVEGTVVIFGGETPAFAAYVGGSWVQVPAAGD